MKERKYTFDFHAYAPELNKIYYCGVDITNHFPEHIRKDIGSEYNYNLRLVREYLGRRIYDHYLTIRFVSTDENKFIKERSGGFDAEMYPAAAELYRELRSWFTSCTPENRTHFCYYYLAGKKKSK